MNSKDITTGCHGSDDHGEFKVETIITADATHEVQALIRRGDGTPAFMTFRWDREYADVLPAEVLKRLPIAG